MERNQNAKPDFKTVKKFEKDYGSRNFLEIALKKLDDGSEIITFSKGFKDQQGNRRYRRSLGVAASEDMKSFIEDAIKNL